MTTKINVHFALAIIAVFSVAVGSMLALRTVRAYGFDVGGQILWIEECESSEALGTECPRCPVCTAQVHSACVDYTEITRLPAGGTPGTQTICVPKGYRYIGGGSYPRRGGYLFGKMLQLFIPYQIGVGR